MELAGKVKWICSQIGARQHYCVPEALHREGLLETMFTDIWAPSFLNKMRLPGRKLRAFAGRNNGAIPEDRVHHFSAGAVRREAWFWLKQRIASALGLFQAYSDYG